MRFRRWCAHAPAPKMLIVVYTGQPEATELATFPRPDAVVSKTVDIADLVSVSVGLLAGGPHDVPPGVSMPPPCPSA